MVGNLVLSNCLNSGKITQIRSLVRKPAQTMHHKLVEIAISDFTDYAAHSEIFKNIDIAFFCIGVYTGQVPDDEFKKITVDYAVEFAKTLKNESPHCTICLLSGAGADKTEKSSTPFACYKGMAENRISELNMKFYSFRPAYIYPVTPRKEPNFLYKATRVLYPVLKMFGTKYSIKSTELANAMFNVGINGAELQILENRDILKYAGSA